MPDIIGHHMRMRLEVDSVIAKKDTDRRRFSRIVLQNSRDSALLAFKAVDTHLHFDLAEPDRGQSVEYCRRISISWRRTYPNAERLITLPPRPIKDVWHLQNTFFYVLDQEKRHKCRIDRYHEASVLSDLLGLRVTGAWLIEKVEQELPRVQWGELWERLGPVDLSRSYNSLDCLADAAAAAVACPDLAGKTREQVAAKRAAVLVASAQLRDRETADLLGMSRQRVGQIQRLNSEQPLDEALVRAVELQLRFRSGMGELLRRKGIEPQVAESGS
jgi:hypothetical protein